jgi:cell wall-associated NlpC family hydrolase
MSKVSGWLKFVFVAMALLVCPAYGQSRGRSADDGQGSRSSPALSADEGLAVIGAALDFSHERHSKPDCSHLVHQIYSDAGFSYPYASSRDLYRGIYGFERVNSPQPGDLIAWRSHSGIVVNPSQHSFYSSLNSGLGVDYYDAEYWRKKGAPRFYRFLTTPGRLNTARR